MEVEALGRSDRKAVVDVLTASFADYPVMRYALSDAGDEYERRLRALNGFFCDARYSRNWPVLGIRDGESLVSVMLLSEPVVTPRPIDLQAAVHDLAESIGEAALDRMNTYEEFSSGIEPDVPYYFVGMLGTLPGYEGRGLAGALLDHVANLAEAHEVAQGVCLATEDERNVRFYEKAGYQIWDEVDMPPIHTWVMWRPNGRDG